jgi:sugar/nucleoside kinase (ribokinase family)
LVDVVCLGHILNEKIIFPDKVIAPVLGSPAAYSSVCLASLGVDVGIVTKIGADFPKVLLEVYNKAGVDKEGIGIGEVSTNNELIYDSDGNKTLKFITRAEDINYSDIPAEYHNAKIFYICPMDHEIRLDTIEKISKLGKTMIIDLGGYGGGTSENHPPVKDGSKIKDLCPYFKVVRASIEDLYHIFGQDICEGTVSEKILGWGAESIVITLGEKGAYVRTATEKKNIPAYPIEKFVDQTGAGDCFSAGFMTQFLKSGDLFISAIYGSATTSYIIERSGGVLPERMPDTEEVEKRVKVIA